mmetsp:Transcript_45522/g.91333  ORF Transcript_45522/g.91333 Transcript_45522/m.91333 type:complete len:110 (-) Transcript_45522:212-541(-)
MFMRILDFFFLWFWKSIFQSFFFSKPKGVFFFVYNFKSSENKKIKKSLEKNLRFLQNFQTIFKKQKENHFKKFLSRLKKGSGKFSTKNLKTFSFKQREVFFVEYLCKNV